MIDLLPNIKEQINKSMDAVIETAGVPCKIFVGQTGHDDYGDPVYDITETIETQVLIGSEIYSIFEFEGEDMEQIFPLTVYFKSDVLNKIREGTIFRARLQSAGKVHWMDFKVTNLVGNMYAGPFKFNCVRVRENLNLPIEHDEGDEL